MVHYKGHVFQNQPEVVGYVDHNASYDHHNIDLCHPGKALSCHRNDQYLLESCHKDQHVDNHLVVDQAIEGLKIYALVVKCKVSNT